MMSQKMVTRVVKDLFPPLFYGYLQRVFRRGGFSGNYLDWEAACRDSSGYDSDLILKKVRASMLQVRDGKAVYERDSVLFDSIQYSWPLLAGILWIASQKENRLNLVDFGGSLGSSYYQNRKFLSHLRELRWSIVEQRNFVECGKREFENEHLKFHHDLDECFRDRRPDAILLSGVLPYMEKPYSLLDTVRSLGFEFIIVDRTPFVIAEKDRLTVQKVPPEIFPASYPCWFFSREKFIREMSDRYLLWEEFDAIDEAGIVGSAFKGFLFRRI